MTRCMTATVLGAILLCGGCSKGRPAFVDAAFAKCAEQGLKEQDLSLSGFETSGGLFGGTAVVKLQLTKGETEKTIRVELRRSALSRKWSVVKYDVGASPPKGLQQN